MATMHAAGKGGVSGRPWQMFEVIGACELDVIGV
jgi:hypothetical protein